MLRNWFLKRSGQRSQERTTAHRSRRSRALRTEMESLEGRSLLSVSGVSLARLGIIPPADVTNFMGKGQSALMQQGTALGSVGRSFQPTPPPNLPAMN